MSDTGTASKSVRSPAQQRARKHWLAAAMASGPVLALAAWVFGPHGLMVEQVAKTWRLEIEVERRVLETGSGWCDELPVGALVLSRRTLDSDPSGQRQGPSEHCHYRSPQWRTSYVAQSQGQAPAAPHWPHPELRLDDAQGQALGAERLGKRQAFYELQLQADDGRQWSCRQNLQEWQARPAQAHYRVQVDRYGVADCASLPPATPPAHVSGTER
ncbi:hypothetical protein LNV23_07640 [Paucibacter sp. DJ1R-11]|uniref:hypothetical protein n=1 Tax=Paucibacter sp. DJ1R-11 TaxID=2893556 RepID=UPI0021E3B750|nr:hypothetical protein [Paucibacter sp. DJ1R-11]MCV2363319.1 hypothetical protein [Paucibacter sp. DJ1R-11]